jgi:KDO2-lipid IV(A) lauroyltransferase
MSDAPGAPRWYTHGWNRDLSWRLILGIIPKVPPALRPPIHLLTTLVCFAAMGRERRAVRRNLATIAGRSGIAPWWPAFRLFYNFSKFMVAYTDVRPYGDGRFLDRVQGRPRGEEVLRQARAGGRGVIVLGMHLGQWDLALVALASLGVPITVVMRREDEEASRFAAEARRAAGIRVAHAGDDPLMTIDLLAALRRNEIVALQGDRPYGPVTAAARMFGRVTPLPAGPAELAAASGAPLLPAALVFEGHRRLRLVFGEPLRVERGGAQDGRAALGGGVARAMEAIIRAYPDQWFNFYDVWGGPAATPAGSTNERTRCATSR